MRQLGQLLAACVIAAAVAASCCNAKFIKAPVQLEGLLPSNLTELYSHLSRRQERIMDEAVKGNDGNETAFLAYIRSKDPKLGEKAGRVFKDFIERLTKLKRPAQKFYLKLFNGLRQLTEKTDERALRRFTHELVLRWIAMKRLDRRSLATQFPSVAHALNSRTVRNYAGVTLR